MVFHLKKKSRPRSHGSCKNQEGGNTCTKLLSIPHAIHPKHGALVGAGSLWPSFEDCQATKFTFLDLKCTLGESQCFVTGKNLLNFNLKNMTLTNTKDF